METSRHFLLNPVEYFVNLEASRAVNDSSFP